MFTPDINAELTTVTLRNGALVGSNNWSNGTDISQFKGKLMVSLICPPAIGDAASNINVKLYSHTNNHAAGTLVHQFSLVTNGAPSQQQVAVDTRNVNGYLSTLLNVLGTNHNSYPFVIAQGFKYGAG